MEDLYINGFPYTLFIKNRENNFGYNIIFEYRGDNSRRKLRMELPYFQLDTQDTCIMQEINNSNDKKMRLLYNRFCKYECLNPNEEYFYQFSNGVIKEIIRNRIIVEKKEEKKIDPEIKEAIDITNEAIKIQKEIIEKTEYIKKRKSDYLRKYGTINEKLKSYFNIGNT